MGGTEWETLGETASRECEEECGLKLGRQTRHTDISRHAQRSHTIFLVHDTRTPQPRNEILAVSGYYWALLRGLCTDLCPGTLCPGLYWIVVIRT